MIVLEKEAEGMIEHRIAIQRKRIGDILTRKVNGLFVVVGPCALTGDVDIIHREGNRIRRLDTDTLATSHRLPVWKPRSNPVDWHGEETTNPNGALATLRRQAKQNANVSIEAGLEHHIDKYAAMLAFAWTGARNIHNRDLMTKLVTHDPLLPIGIKNDLSGDIDSALNEAQRLSSLREDDDAPVVLLFRGGDNAKTPEDWEEQYKVAFERTEGRLIVDTAHGGEMAHAPDVDFTKSVIGQIACLEHVIQLTEGGLVPAGIMIEASDAVSPTDPNMPHSNAISGVQRLHQLVI